MFSTCQRVSDNCTCWYVHISTCFLVGSFFVLRQTFKYLSMASVAECHPEFLILLYLPPHCCNYRHALTYWVWAVFGTITLNFMYAGQALHQTATFLNSWCWLLRFALLPSSCWKYISGHLFMGYILRNPPEAGFVFNQQSQFHFSKWNTHGIWINCWRSLGRHCLQSCSLLVRPDIWGSFWMAEGSERLKIAFMQI